MSKLILAQKSDNYIKNVYELKGKRTVFTEINIDASSELVRNKFLEFSKWSKWCKVIPKIRVLSGDINNLETKIRFNIRFWEKERPSKSSCKSNCHSKQ